MTAPVQLAAARLLRLAVSLRAGVSPDKADADAIIAAVERWHWNAVRSTRRLT